LSQQREIAGLDPVRGLAYWSGVVARFDAFVGSPPTPLTEAIDQVVRPAHERFEVAARDDDQAEKVAAVEQLMHAGDQAIALATGGTT
jgi:hypothetical protein